MSVRKYAKTQHHSWESILETPEMPEHTHMNELDQIDIYRCLTTYKKSTSYFSSSLRCSFLSIIMSRKFCEFEFPIQEYAIEILELIPKFHFTI